MTARAGPDLSVVLVTPDDVRSIADTLAHLRRQTARDRIELLVVAASAAALGVPVEEAAGTGFHSVRLVEHGPVVSRGRTAASGVRAARGPIVAFAENHCFPDPEWAEALLAAHQGPWAVVGPAVRNANPRTRTSRINFLLTYGLWADPEPGEVDLLPFHNSAYKREWLEPYGDDLGAMLDGEYWLQRDVRARGGRLWVEPRARAAHVNEPLLATSLRLFACQGRAFGAGRSHDWSPLRRATYVAASPAIPLVNLPAALGAAGRHLSGGELARSLPSVALHVLARAAGETLGYLRPDRGDEAFLHAHEFSRRGSAAEGS